MSAARRPVNGGLQLDEPAAISETDYDSIVNKWKGAEEWAKQAVIDQLGPQSARPNYISGKELMTISPTEYAEAFTYRLSWCNEVRRHQVAAKVALQYHECIENELERKVRLSNRTLSKLSATKLTVEELRDRVGQHPNHEHIELEKSKYLWLKLFLDQEYEEAEQNLKAISRQVEMRKEEFGGERRDGNIPQNLRKYKRDES